MHLTGGLTIKHETKQWYGTHIHPFLPCCLLHFLHTKFEEEDWPYLHQHDQLIREKAAGNKFHTFTEAAINFVPTYKYQPGTDRYDRRPEKKKMRLPAWCDRIQWTGAGVECVQYDRAELHTSDHKPVFCLYKLQAKVLVVQKRDAVKQHIARPTQSSTKLRCAVLQQWPTTLCLPAIHNQHSVVGLSQHTLVEQSTQTIER